jgi:polyisoprenoid-binding protein YceI
MKEIPKMSRLTVALLAVALPLSAVAAPESYTIDPFHTFPNFEVNHLGMSNIRGQFTKTTGKFSIDHAAKTGTLDLAVQTASITTGDTDKAGRPRTRDEHLRTPDFFNVAEFPTMTYKSTGVKFNGDNPATVDGNLTLLGVSKPVTLHVENWKCGANPMSKKEMCGGNASAALKRSDFGMKFGLPAIGDDLKLWIEIEGYKD